jgi:hypothetical protein
LGENTIGTPPVLAERGLGDAIRVLALDCPVVQLVLHAQDELSHHGAEVALLRDLYLRINPNGQLSAI